MTIVFLTTEEEQKTIRKLNRGELGEDVEAVISPIMTNAVERAKRRIT